jgi:hypothetical protein
VSYVEGRSVRAFIAFSLPILAKPILAKVNRVCIPPDLMQAGVLIAAGRRAAV